MGASWDEVQEGMEIPTLEKNCSTQQLVYWAAGSGDFYQIHYDHNFARATGLENIIVHGALKHAFLGQLLHDWVGNEGRVKRVGCSYRGMDLPRRGHPVQGRGNTQVRRERRAPRRPRDLDGEPGGEQDLARERNRPAALGRRIHGEPA